MLHVRRIVLSGPSFRASSIAGFAGKRKGSPSQRQTCSIFKTGIFYLLHFIYCPQIAQRHYVRGESPKVMITSYKRSTNIKEYSTHSHVVISTSCRKTNCLDPQLWRHAMYLVKICYSVCSTETSTAMVVSEKSLPHSGFGIWLLPKTKQRTSLSLIDVLWSIPIFKGKRSILSYAWDRSRYFTLP